MGLESKVVEEVQKESELQIDREKTCPLLLRVFCNTTGRHNRPNDYVRQVPSNELQIHTWLDATLKEITRLITDVYPNTKTKGTTFNFSVVWPNQRGPGFRMKEIGSTTIGTKGPDDNATLQSKKFVIGDYLDVSVDIARSHGRDTHDRRDRAYSSSYDRRARPY
ncbi:histone deacetylase complex subunit SAP18 [Brachionus plicatilis]|uniref:18 kDa Sin3-associated polypeptide n=1 Tax=Brachionus plicatilis TaxID=10195 RepID=A0A3M7Q2U6_BRAPC|nr:histone deacetylase complex subunit SAP18 [Brachionus plicatilis]